MLCDWEIANLFELHSWIASQPLVFGGDLASSILETPRRICHDGCEFVIAKKSLQIVGCRHRSPLCLVVILVMTANAGFFNRKAAFGQEGYAL
jgi:hypothetical protein